MRKKLIPLLDDDTRPGDQEASIALDAANAIARMVDKEERDGEGSSAEFIRKARAWAEAVQAK